MRHHIQRDKGVAEGDEQMKDLTLAPLTGAPCQNMPSR